MRSDNATARLAVSAAWQLQAAVIIIAAREAAAAHKDYGWSTLISQLLICHSLQMLERLKTAGLASLIELDRTLLIISIFNNNKQIGHAQHLLK